MYLLECKWTLMLILRNNVVLGLLSFLIYLNDITLMTGRNMKLFADDTTLYMYIEFYNPDEVTEIINEVFENIQQ